jgi:hypothetical protein
MSRVATVTRQQSTPLSTATIPPNTESCTSTAAGHCTRRHVERRLTAASRVRLVVLFQSFRQGRCSTVNSWSLYLGRRIGGIDGLRGRVRGPRRTALQAIGRCGSRSCRIGAASSVCLNAGPNAGQADIDSFTSHVNAAMAHFTRAQEIGAGAARPLPRPGLPN